jgi:glyceraldehyde-3-phosphate dehydrogenase type II
MTIKVGIVGAERIGKRVTRAVAAQDDMVPVRAATVRERVAPDRSLTVAAWTDPNHPNVVVNCGPEPLQLDVPVIQGPGVRREQRPCFSVLTAAQDILGQRSVQVASANVLAFGRLLRALRSLGPITRFFASTFRRAGHATDPSTGCVDALQPLFADSTEDEELSFVFADLVPKQHVSRTRGPYTHSDLHMLKIDFATPPSAADVLSALKQAPRLMVGAARDGFANTAQVQEFFRDLGGANPDSYTVFIWEESVAVIDDSVVLMADVSPETTPVPEIIDAIRLNQTPGLTLAESLARTDAALGVRTRWADWRREP